MALRYMKGRRVCAAAVSIACCAAATAQAEQVRIRAIGSAHYVSDALGQAFTPGEKALVFLTYDTDAPLVTTSDNTVMIAQTAVRFFAITDVDYNFFFTYETSPGGELRVTDGGLAGDGFGYRSFTDAKIDKYADTGMRGPPRNDLPLLSAGLKFMTSATDITTHGQIPVSVGDPAVDWATLKPWFYLQYCSGCGPGRGNRTSVSFNLDLMQTYILTDELFNLKKKGDALVARGEIDVEALTAFAKASKASPKAATLSLLYVPGSNNDDANRVLSKQVRAAKMKTHVPDGGLIASGGVDLFLAGTERSLGANACVGVHSWEEDGKQGKDYPRNSDKHKEYLETMREMGVDEAFYWFTLEKAGADQMYYMSASEVNQYGVTTVKTTEALGSQTDCTYRQPPS